VIAAAAPQLAEVALQFGPADYFSLMVFGLVGAVILARGSVVKAIGMILIGILIGTIGIDVNSSIPRFTFGIMSFGDGIEFAVIAMGLFGIGETIANLGLGEEGRTYVSNYSGLWPKPESCVPYFRPPCAALCWVRPSAFFQGAGRCSRPSRPTPSRRRSRKTPVDSAAAPSKALPDRRPPTMRRHKPRSSPC